MRIYISGPMTGHEDLNRPFFRDAQFNLEDMGHEVYNPGEHTHATRRLCMEADLGWICRNAEGMVMLWDWGWSSGAGAELATARALALPIWYQEALHSEQFMSYDQRSPKGEALYLGRAA